MRVLVAGWFSFPEMGATAGDVLARDVVCRWLRDAGLPYDVAVAPPFSGGVDWQSVSPAEYSHVVFVCGPFGNGWPIPGFLARFAGARLAGVNLSMLDPVEVWNPFDLLLERDSSRTSRPELAFLSQEPPVPVVGVALVHRQREYARALHHLAEDAIRRLTETRPMAVVPIDTRLDVDARAHRCAAEVETLIARMDVVLTTRLHGMVLAIKNGVPVVAIDPIGGGAKIARQAQTIGWRMCYVADALDDGVLESALNYCLTAEARAEAAECRLRAGRQLADVRAQFLAAMASPKGPR